MPAVWGEFCLPLQGQTRHSCDGQWHQSFPHQTRCHIHCPAPSGGHLCNKRRALIQENITVSYLMLQPKLQINWPISELAATSTFPPPSMKDVIVSTLMFPPKSTGGKNRKLFLIHWDNDDACNYIVDFEEKKKNVKFTFNWWRKDDQMVIHELAVFDQRQGGIISGLECDVKATIWKEKYNISCTETCHALLQ